MSLGGVSLPREPILDSVIAWACSAYWPKWPSKEKNPYIKYKIPNYFFGGNFAAPGADFR